ncbi:MAG: hypothetical protein JNN15_15105, partial [Blastocatellia bacterium]|nr:hypothetical protein [Blastocatellia bacterium]
MENSLAARILASLGIVVLKRVNESHFKIVGTIPEWFSSYFQHQNLEVEKLLPGTLFPFIETFLFDAEDFWNSNSGNVLKSDLWSESDTEGNEIHLGASALCLEGEKVLLIQLLSETYEEKQLLLQQLREDRLSYDQKLKEMRAEVLAGTKSSDLKGEVLADRYQLQSVLGQGGLGIVYKAYDRQTKGFVAVKLL